MIKITINGIERQVEDDISVAAALLNAGIWHFRTSVQGGVRAPICAMGVCFECRVTIDGQAHRRACLESCRAGMEIIAGA